MNADKDRLDSLTERVLSIYFLDTTLEVERRSVRPGDRRLHLQFARRERIVNRGQHRGFAQLHHRVHAQLGLPDDEIAYPCHWDRLP